MAELRASDYTHLLRFRTALRRSERWSEDSAKSVGLTPAQHQLLLSVTGHPDPLGPTISEVADYLLIRHHSAVGLIDRTAQAGLLTRVRDLSDARVIRLQLTAVGVRCIEQLAMVHVAELRRLAPLLEELSQMPVDNGAVDTGASPAVPVPPTTFVS